MFLSRFRTEVSETIAPQEGPKTPEQLLQELIVRVGQLEGENSVLQSLINTLPGGDGGRAKIDPPPKYGGDKEALTRFLT